MKRFARFLPLLLALGAFAASAQSLDEQYVQVYNLIIQGDRLRDAGQPADALKTYSEAQTRLKRISESSPDWNVVVVRFRLGYLEKQISEQQEKAASMPVPAEPAPGTTPAQPAGPAVVPSDVRRLVEELQSQVRRLEGDKSTLESKLREALSARPAPLDARRLETAEQEVRALQKENEILKLSLRQERERVTMGAAENEETAKLRLALAEANTKLSEQAELIARLRLEREALQMRVQQLAANPSAEALKLENEKLKQQVAELTAKAQRADELGAQVDAARKAMQDAVAQMEKLSDEKAALERQVKQMTATTPAEPAEAPINLAAARMKDENAVLTARLKNLETELADAKRLVVDAAESVDRMMKERTILMAKVTELEAANAKMAAQAKADAEAVASGRRELDGQIAKLRAEVAVFQAKKIPFTPEELALFEKPAAPEKPMAKEPVREDLAAWVSQAEKAYANRKLDDAENLYKRALQEDAGNPLVLANLALVQFEQGRLDEAAATLAKAIAAAPDDAYNLTLMGIIQYRGAKYDDALQSLSRAAQLDPKNAEIQNYLGITLSQKGLRGPAETALRRAIQLSPGYASAHHNLAVSYATARPVSTELALYHYRKALEKGHAPNPELEKLLGNPQQAAK